jgi:folylpolyglutamate synthase
MHKIILLSIALTKKKGLKPPIALALWVIQAKTGTPTERPGAEKQKQNPGKALMHLMWWMGTGLISTVATAGTRRLGATSNVFRAGRPPAGPSVARIFHHSASYVLSRQDLFQRYQETGLGHRRPRLLPAAIMASLSAGLHQGQDTDKSSTSSLDFASLPRTYESALHLLSLLPTNRDVTSLFEAPPKDENGTPFDFNSLAIPEVIAWMARAGYADLSKDLAPLRCIHIAGTKGKGSVSAFATAILVEAAKANDATVGRVGTYLSPHVVSVRERIWLDGKPINRELFTQYVFELWARLSEAAAAADSSDPDPYGAHTKPFYFRFLTLLAFHVFLREGVRSAVIECGIGGEYDATNILPASSATATVVTRLGIDHVAMLGRTLEEIAWHKAGIFKEGVSAFTLQHGPVELELDGNATPPGESQKDRDAAVAILHTRAVEKKAQALYELPPGIISQWAGIPGAGLPGAFQKYNMALAAAAARDHLRKAGATDGQESDSTDAILDLSRLPEYFVLALAKATLRGRCEAISDTKTGTCKAEYIIDGAHTADSLGEVARFFVARQKKKGAEPHSVEGVAPAQPRRILLFSVRDRNPGDLLRALLAGTSAGGTGIQRALFDNAFFVFPPEAVAAREEALSAMQDASPNTVSQAVDGVPAAIGQIRALAAEPVGHSSGASADAKTASQQACQVLATGSFVLVREVLQELDAEFES